MLPTKTGRRFRHPSQSGLKIFKPRLFQTPTGAPQNTFLAAITLFLAAASVLSSLAHAQDEALKSSAVNLKEQIPDEYRDRYDRWKKTFLSVGAGRQLWVKYAASPVFHLTIAVSKNEGKGARVQDYTWADNKLAGATIVLGYQLDQGYPSQADYPTLGSLAFTRDDWEGFGKNNVLAAAKIAHEFGHIDHAANANAAVYKLQNELSAVYISHFLSNGHNADDPLLKELVELIGGTPAQITNEREYRAEAYSLRYLLSKLGEKGRQRLLRFVRQYCEPIYVATGSGIKTSVGICSYDATRSLS